MALVLAVVLAAAVASASVRFGGGSHVGALGAGSRPTTLAPTRPAARHPGHGSAFIPAPAAVALAASMPLERQVAQLFAIGVEGTAPAAVPEAPAWGGLVFDSSNFSTDTGTASYAASEAAAIRSAGAPTPLIAATQEGGPETALPDAPPQGEAVLGASGQPAAARAQALLAARRLLALGFNMTLAPLADVDTQGGALSGRLFSTDPATVARFAAEAVAGYRAAGIISAVGHFPGEGGASADPDQLTATVGESLDQLRGRDLVPFAAISSSAPVIVMSNALYAAFDGVTPAGLLRQAVDLLRRGDGFQGVVMSDDLDAALQATGADIGAAALAALRAGDDLLYVSGSPAEQQSAYEAVLAAARGSDAVRRRVRHALLRVLTLKARYGLLGSGQAG